MKQAHELLSELGVRYGNGVQTQDELEARLAACKVIVQAVENEVYYSPGVSPSNWGGVTNSDPRVTKQAQLSANLPTVMLTGDLVKIHKTIDSINKLRAAVGMPFYIPDSDFDLLRKHAIGVVGEVARELQTREDESEDGLFTVAGWAEKARVILGQ